MVRPQCLLRTSSYPHGFRHTPHMQAASQTANTRNSQNTRHHQQRALCPRLCRTPQSTTATTSTVTIVDAPLTWRPEAAEQEAQQAVLAVVHTLVLHKHNRRAAAAAVVIVVVNDSGTTTAVGHGNHRQLVALQTQDTEVGKRPKLMEKRRAREPSVERHSIDHPAPAAPQVLLTHHAREKHTCRCHSHHLLRARRTDTGWRVGSANKSAKTLMCSLWATRQPGKPTPAGPGYTPLGRARRNNVPVPFAVASSSAAASSAAASAWRRTAEQTAASDRTHSRVHRQSTSRTTRVPSSVRGPLVGSRQEGRHQEGSLQADSPVRACQQLQQAIAASNHTLSSTRGRHTGTSARIPPGKVYAHSPPQHSHHTCAHKTLQNSLSQGSSPTLARMGVRATTTTHSARRRHRYTLAHAHAHANALALTAAIRDRSTRSARSATVHGRGTVTRGRGTVAWSGSSLKQEHTVQRQPPHSAT